MSDVEMPQADLSGSEEGSDFNKIAEFIPLYPALTDPEFSYNIARKKEFNDFELTSDYTQLPGLFRQQVIIQRFLSPQTLYNELLVYHRVGAGKTATALAVCEAWKMQDRNTDLCAQEGGRLVTPSQCPLIIVGYVKRFLPIFENQLIKHFPEYSFEAGLPNKERRTAFKYNYHVKSYYDVGKNFINLSDRIIIIDEAHNLLTEKNGGIADNIRKKLQKAKNLKILLLTGTPIEDKASQIIPLMNLILPHPIPSFPKGKNFDNMYFDEKEDFKPQTTKCGKEYDSDYDLTQKFKGRVSYFRSIIPSIRRIDKGKSDVAIEKNPYSKKEKEKEKEKEGETGTEDEKELLKLMEDVDEDFKIGTKKFPVVCNQMSEDQYEQVCEIEKYTYKKKKDVLAKKILAASVMVFPDPLSQTHSKNLPKEMKKQIDRMPKDLKDLKKYSAIFYSIVKDINTHPRSLFFIYLTSVEVAGGQKNFKYVLNHFLPKVKYKILELEDEKSTIRDLRTPKNGDILNEFNAPGNCHGDHIQVLIGGLKSGEGITIKNVTRVHLFPWWHFSRHEQAVVRTIRPDSHDALIKDKIRALLAEHKVPYKKVEFDRVLGLTRKFALEIDKKNDIEEVITSIHNITEFEPEPEKDGNKIFVEWKGTIKVNVFLHVAVGPKHNSGYKFTRSAYQFKRAFNKYVKTEQVLEFLKKISFDCPLTYPKNVVAKKENYTCLNFPEKDIQKNGENGVWKYSIPRNQIQYDTYDLFYTDRKAIIDTLIPIFAANSVRTFNQLVEKTENRPNPLLGALQEMISRNYPLKNRFGFRCCLREDRDMYFLVGFHDAFRHNQTYEHAIYPALPFVTYQTSLQTLNDDFNWSAEDLNKFCEDPTKKAYNQLSSEARFYLLEEIFKNKSLKPPEFINTLLKNNIHKMENDVFVHVMFSKFHNETGGEYKIKLSNTGKMRVLDLLHKTESGGAGPSEAEWRYAFQGEEDKYIKILNAPIAP